MLQPGDGIGGFHDQTAQQLRPGGKMSSAERIQIVAHRAVVLLVRGLNTALGHHGVGVAHAQLGGDQHPGPGLFGLQRRGAAGPAGADNQHIRLIIGLSPFQGNPQQPGIGLQQISQFLWHPGPTAGTRL